MKNLLYLILLFWMPFVISAQSKVDFSKFKGKNAIEFKTTAYLQNTSFCEYNIKHKPNPVKTNALSPNISSPENLLSALSQAKDEKAFLALWGTGEAAAIVEGLQPLTQVDSLHYFLITEKLEFDYQGSRKAILKYFRVENEIKSKPFSIQLQKQGENWFIIRKQELTSLEYLIRHLKYKMLYKFLEKGSNGDEAIDAIAKKCLSEEGTLNYQKLYDALKQEIDDKTPLAVRIAE